MTKLYTSFRRFTAAAVFLLLIVSPALAQEALPGVMRIKVSETLAAHLETNKQSLNTQGEVVTGHEPLDQLNRQFRVKLFTRVFPHAGKNEAKHRRHGLHLWYTLSADLSMPLSNMLQSYRSEIQILKAEPVYKKAINRATGNHFGPKVIKSPLLSIGLPGSSNDPMLASQWHFRNTGQTGGIPGADIKLLDAWKLETGRNNVVIAVTDGGIQADHVDLAANMWVNPGEIPGNNNDDDNNGYVDDLHGYSFVERSGKVTAGSHATHVGGTIAAVTNNGLGVAGVAGGSNAGDGVRLMSCAVFLNDSAADGFAEAYVYSADNGAVISQNSWGYMFPDVYEEVVLDAIDYFIAEAGRDENGNQRGPVAGGLVIFSAGNDNSHANYYPASYEPVLAVASSTHRDRKAQYSNFGSWVDITAPGGETYETSGQGVLSTLPGNQYGYFMGTSMACPHVSGVAGLIVSKFGGDGFNQEMLRKRLLSSVDNIDSLNSGYARQLGTGRVNAVRALAESEPIPPERVTDLAVASIGAGEITLTWTSPADPNDFAALYDLRHATFPITLNNFQTAQSVAGVPSPKPAGTKENFTIKKLSGGVQYYFAIRSIDFEGNISALSNVVSKTSAPTPAIVVTPASLSGSLKTAERSIHPVVIRNEGKAPLHFFLQGPEAENAFFTAEPLSGVVSPAGEQILSVTLDASGYLTGTYNQHIVVHHDDPEKDPVVVPLTLHVTSNGSPIASILPDDVDFGSGKIGYSVVRSIVLTNEGSDALLISGSTSNHEDFRADLTQLQPVAPFSSTSVRLIFTPSSRGMVDGIISLQTNDPASRTLQIHVKGEGLEETPVAASPNSFNETLEQGSKVTRNMALKNNGAGDRAYKLSVMNIRRADTQVPASAFGRRATKPDSTAIAQQRILQKRQTQFATSTTKEKNLIQPVAPSTAQGKPSGTTGRKYQASISAPKQYSTGFEEFIPGAVGEQNGWYATDNWDISGENPDGGKLHLRGTSRVSAVEKYVMSPYLFEEYDYPHYTSASMRINGDRAKGVAWEVVPQDPWSYVATRIRFNADGTIDALVIDNDYAFHWKRVPVAKPSGYFELAIEYNNWASDTSGFPTYHVFINNRHVFSGTGLASGIGQVVFSSAMETGGPVCDVDEFKLAEGEYIPQFITTDPVSGIIPAGQSANVAVEFNASVMKTGNYEADIIMHIDADTLVVPAALRVTGTSPLAGKILREKWTHLPGVEVSSIPLMTPPDSAGLLSRFESPANTGDNYGTRIRGYVEAPLSGYYTFWIASNDNSELWLGTDEDPTTKRKIASVAGYTNSRQWDKYPAQKSAQIYLVANSRYYIEALHKEGVGTDHVAVGWQLPDQSMERPIPGMRLFPYDGDLSGSPPRVTIVSPQEAENFSAPATIQLEADAADDDGEVVKVEFLNGTEVLGADFNAPYTFTWKNVPVGNYTVVVKATDNSGSNGLATVNISVSPGQGCAEAGSIVREQWNNIPGTLVSAIPVDQAPSLMETITLFESRLNIGDHYGTRIRGFLCVPVSGRYTFWISGNDMSELWLSPDSSPAKKKKIAYVPGYTDVRQWTKYPSQQSIELELIAGEKYYIEALHKEGVGTDHMAVGWQLPDGTLERPIAGIRLLPFLPAVCTAAGNIMREYWTGVSGDQVTRIPVNTDPEGVERLTSFEGPVNTGSNYGARIRGYICPPQTGDYHFWIASNDHSELWLSTDANPENKVKIAFLTRATGPRQWEIISSQKSAAIRLVQGKRYYIEALHKQGVGTDHIAVGWQLPDATMERPIGGERLSPFEEAGFSEDGIPGWMLSRDRNAESGPPDIRLYPNPMKGERLNIDFENIPAWENQVRELEIRQMTGVPVYSEKINCAADCDMEIDLSKNLPSGVYLVQVRVDDRIFTQKLVVP